MTITESKLNKIVKDYSLTRSKYLKLTASIKTILKKSLKKSNIHFAYIKGRTKKSESLKNKIRELENQNTFIDKFQKLDDLSGCRVVIYLDSESSTCANFIYKTFGKENISKSRFKYKKNGFEARYLIVKIDKKSDFVIKNNLVDFDGMMAEIQVVTVLFDTWSFLAHNTIYKPDRRIATFDEKIYEFVEKELSSIVEKHIRPMNTSFEYIRTLISKAEEGTEVFDARFLNKLGELDSNNEMYQGLELLKKQLEEFGDKSPQDMNIVDVVKKVIAKSKKNKKQKALTDFGYFPGFDYFDILKKCIEILGLGQIRYLYPKDILEVVLMLIKDNKDNNIDTALKRLLEDFSRYHLNAIKKIGLGQQMVIVDFFEGLTDKEFIKNAKGFCWLVPKILEPSYEGTEMKDYQTFSLLFGPLNVTDGLKNLRRRIVNQLLRLFTLNKSYQGQKMVIDVMSYVFTFPMQGNYGEDMVSMIVADGLFIRDFFETKTKNIDYKLIRIIEDNFERLLTNRLIKSEKSKEIKNYIDFLNNDEDYKFFKLFYGFDHDYSQNKGWRLLESERKSKIDSILKKVNTKNIKKWESKIIKVIKNVDKSDFSKYNFYNDFLLNLGKSKPKVAINLVNRYEKKLSNFLLYLLSGILLSKHQKLANKKINEWLKSQNNLSVISKIPFYTKIVDHKVGKRLLVEAIKLKDYETINDLGRSCIFYYDGSSQQKALFIDSIIELNKAKRIFWTSFIRTESKSIFEDLTKEETALILDNLLPVKSIDYNHEEILSEIAKKYPIEAVNFFYKRLNQKKLQKDTFGYSAIPYDFYELSDMLSKQEKIILPEICKWFETKDVVIKYEAGGLLKKIFKTFSGSLETYLSSLLDRDKLTKLEIETILFTFRAYDGETFLHPLYQKLITKIPSVYVETERGEVEQELIMSLSQTGVVTGEYGMVEAYKRKVIEVESWSNQSNQLVRNFAKVYKDYLEKRIPYEEKSSDTELDMMKKEFGN